MPTLQRGSIVDAVVADPQGQNAKERPLVILTPTNEIRVGEPLVCVAVSGTFPNPLPDDHVALPFNPAGPSKTGLRKPCAAVCTWLIRITCSADLKRRGFVPPKQMHAILEKVQRAIAPPPADEHAE